MQIVPEEPKKPFYLNVFIGEDHHNQMVTMINDFAGNRTRCRIMVAANGVKAPPPIAIPIGTSVMLWAPKITLVRGIAIASPAPAAVSNTFGKRSARVLSIAASP